MGERARRAVRNHPKLVWSVAVGLVVAGGLAWRVWDISHECVRWITRIHFKDYADRPIRVCEEWRSRWGRDGGK